MGRLGASRETVSNFVRRAACYARSETTAKGPPSSGLVAGAVYRPAHHNEMQGLQGVSRSDRDPRSPGRFALVKALTNCEEDNLDDSLVPVLLDG